MWGHLALFCVVCFVIFPVVSSKRSRRQKRQLSPSTMLQDKLDQIDPTVLAQMNGEYESGYPKPKPQPPAENPVEEETVEPPITVVASTAKPARIVCYAVDEDALSDHLATIGGPPHSWVVPHATEEQPKRRPALNWGSSEEGTTSSRFGSAGPSIALESWLRPVQNALQLQRLIRNG